MPSFVREPTLCRLILRKSQVEISGQKFCWLHFAGEPASVCSIPDSRLHRLRANFGKAPGLWWLMGMNPIRCFITEIELRWIYGKCQRRSFSGCHRG